MSLEEKMFDKNIELKNKVSDEIKRVQKGESKKNLYQLQTILNELYLIEQGKELILSYPRLILDSWDYSDSLGLELLEFAEKHKKISRY